MAQIKRFRRGKQLLALASLSGGLALGGYGIASATTATTATTSPSSAPGATRTTPPWGPGGGGGTVTSVSPTSLVVTTPDGTSTTYVLTSTTLYYKGQTTSTYSSLAVGERVNVAVSTTATTTATSVRIVEPMLSGTIQSISGSSIVIADQQGFWHTLTISGSTAYSEAGSTVNSSALKVGEMVSATGTIASDHTTLAADSITVQLPHFTGSVTAVSGDVITITGRGGASQTINVDSSTTYTSGATTSTLSSVTVGTVIDAEGTITSTNVMSARTIRIGAGNFGPGPGGGRGFGPQGGPGGAF